MKGQAVVTKLPLSPEFGVTGDLEQDAVWAESELLDVRVKLADIMPVLLRINEHFRANKRGSITFRGCRSWREYCKKRLHVTPQAICMLKKRMALGQAVKEAARKEAKEKRQQEKWFRRSEETLRKTEFARGHDQPWVEQMAEAASASEYAASEPEYETSGDEDDDDALMPNMLAVVGETVALLGRIIASGLLASDPVLLAETKAHAARATNVCADVRQELKIGGGKVVSINAGS